MKKKVKKKVKKKFGIATIKKAISIGLGVAKGFHNALEDGKINFFESIMIGSKIFPIIEVVRDRRLLMDELRDLDEAERTEIKEFVQKEYNIPSEAAERTVQESLIMFLNIATFTIRMREIWTKQEEERKKLKK